MKKLIRWGVLGVAAVALALAGCGNSSSGSASVRIANATLTHPSLDFYINGGLAQTGTATDTVSNYSTPGSGANTLQINDTATGSALSVTAPNLSGNDHYTLVAYETGGVIKTAVIPEDFAAPVSGNFELRIYNAAPDAGKLDVYITGATDSLATASPAASFTTGVVPSATVLLTYPVGTYRVRVTAAGSKTDLRLDMPAVALTNQQVGTVILTPTTGGNLLNGSVLVEQSTYTAVRNTNTRVRLAAAVAGGATIAATATAPAGAPATSVACTGAGNTCTIDSGSVAPAFDFYTLVPAGSSLNVTANGATIAAPAASAVTAGADLTLLVYGNTAAAATASLLVDDNHVPTDTTTVKLALINGVTGTPGNLTLTANNALVAQGVAPGTESASTPVQGSTSAMTLQITSSTGTVTLAPTTTTLNQGSVYTVFVGGPSTGPTLLLH